MAWAFGQHGVPVATSGNLSWANLPLVIGFAGTLWSAENRFQTKLTAWPIFDEDWPNFE
ncbi:hypothetical protein HW571_27155 [Agrobacterium genomosp. 3]|uniref:hypothetical protein n=1 Tax=Agrobacterium tomkonis TaxID=1183410 RepID=UPI001CD8312F|nr:hypothetical protein [Agrobacterium tomkonis]MCA1879658.1 hypothetical protein [Agrobacterium tumefaciens]MCA1894887.1 hypothetical protein [Agrobacterium tomkonis]